MVNPKMKAGFESAMQRIGGMDALGVPRSVWEAFYSIAFIDGEVAAIDDGAERLDRAMALLAPAVREVLA